jgi:hypothetical protein
MSPKRILYAWDKSRPVCAEPALGQARWCCIDGPLIQDKESMP